MFPVKYANKLSMSVCLNHDLENSWLPLTDCLWFNFAVYIGNNVSLRGNGSATDWALHRANKNSFPIHELHMFEIAASEFQKWRWIQSTWMNYSWRLNWKIKKTIYLLTTMLVITIRSKSIQQQSIYDDDVVTTAPFTYFQIHFDKFLLFNIDFEDI